MINKIKSKLLTYLFTDWVKNEFDTETLGMARTMIENKEILIKTIIDTTNRVEIKGYRQHCS
tara:strand:- start:711 stop:896 length:186 start_codon:yes stop_codon:yes gene_type:complete